MRPHRPHIAVVVPGLSGGGAERVAATLATQFASSARVTVVTFDPRIPRRDVRRDAGRPLPWADAVPRECDHAHLAASGSGVRRLLRLVAAFRAFAATAQVTAVCSFLTYTNVLVAIARIGRRDAYSHVASEHALAVSLASDGSRLRLLRPVLGRVYRLPDRIVAVSDRVAASLLDAGAVRESAAVVTIPNPVDVERVRALAAGADPLVGACQLPGPLVVCVARLHPDKDHATLLRACATLPPPLSLLLVGDGPLRRDLQRLAVDLGIDGRVVFTGGVSNPYPLMRRADVVVLPSAAEGFGLVAVEAAALGTPFIGSDAGGLGDLCERLGLPTFRQGDHRQLAHLIRSVLDATPAAVPDELLAPFSPVCVARSYLSLLVADPAAERLAEVTL